MGSEVLDAFHPAVREWFRTAFPGPTPAQAQAWPIIRNGENTLLMAPTGSGKTLAAFLSSIDELIRTPARGCRVVYVSPLKALAVDVERNLRSPVAGIGHAAERLGIATGEVRVAIRTGDTPAKDRARFSKTPADIFITTPESLFLILTSQAREALAGVETVIVDEVHAVAGTKRGAHLALSLERLDRLLPKGAQRIGLSATVRPLEEVARFLSGGRPVTIVQPPSDKKLDLSVVVPVEDFTDPAGVGPVDPMLSPEERHSVWPTIDQRLVDLIRAHRSTIVFANSRRLAERLCSRINDLAGEQIARAHHGSVSREQRLLIEEDLKAGRLPAVVATSSLELGIDMG
ncbi:MAG TPA: DEAD/DEAH box helicase, partial [Actinobacteria bacterium]|nr:DEAD/DEAH box helicase [Actinomycetota bacterium]